MRAAPPRAGAGSPARRPCSAAPPAPRRPPRAAGSERDELARRPRPGTGRAARAGATATALGAGAQLVAGDVVVDLPGAEDEPPHRARGRRSGRRAPAGTTPSARSASVDDASFSRSRPFGVITTSGRALGVERLPAEQVEVLRRGRAVRDRGCSPARRAGGTARAARSSAPARCPRSRAGAAASAVSVWPHFERPETMNWSIDDLRAVDEVAELRLPEHERLGRRDRVAVLEAEARRTPRAASCGPRTTPSPRRGAGSARSARRCRASWRTRWRCENVPRSVSWPVSRIGMPSTSRLANASASAWPQSIPPSSSASRAALELARELRVDGEAVRHARAARRSSSRSRSAGDGGDDLGAGRRPGCAPRARPPARPRRRSPSAARAPPSASLLAPRRRARSASSCVTTPSVDERCGVLLAHASAARAIRARHQRLRVRGLVLLVVAEAPVADEVDDDVVAEAARGTPARAGSRRAPPRDRRR